MGSNVTEWRSCYVDGPVLAWDLSHGPEECEGGQTERFEAGRVPIVESLRECLVRWAFRA